MKFHCKCLTIIILALKTKNKRRIKKTCVSNIMLSKELNLLRPPAVISCVLCINCAEGYVVRWSKCPVMDDCGLRVYV